MAGNQLRAAGIVVFRRFMNEVQYLLLQASNGTHGWTPPKGHVDPGESDIETAYRETEEEAGFKKDDLILLDFNKTINYTAWGKPKSVLYMLAELKNAEQPVIISSEHQAYEWSGIDQACELGKFDTLVLVLRECHDYLSSH